MKELKFIEALLPQPTPIQRLDALASYLGANVELTIKRDDLTVLPFGGNKTRKLAYLLHDAVSQGAEIVMTTGAVQSNHCRQTAAAARMLGLKPILVLGGERSKRPSGNYFVDLLMDAEIHWTTMEARLETLNRLYEELKSAGRKPYFITYGGSNALGAAAYAFAMKELIETQNFHPDVMIFASSSGGTQAGLVAGARLFGYKGRIIGISVDEPEEKLREKVASLATQVTELLDIRTEITTDEIEVIDTYAKPGYGVMTEKEKNAILTCARVQGCIVDPVYTGRAMAALMDMLKSGYFKDGTKVLFWHTGGSPAIFADRYSSAILS